MEDVYDFRNYRWALLLKNKSPLVSGMFVNFVVLNELQTETLYPQVKNCDFAFCPLAQYDDFLKEKENGFKTEPLYILYFNVQDIERLQMVNYLGESLHI